MPASSTTKRILGLLVTAACVAAAAGGVWYVRNGAGVHEEDDDIALDDEPDDLDPKHAGGPLARPKKKPGQRRAKGNTGAHAASGPRGPAGPIGPSGMSYEAAIAGNNVHLTPGQSGHTKTPDLTDVQLAGPMRNATFLDACGVPSSTHVTVKVAIRNGHAVGVSVYSIPPSPESDSCVERRVRGLYWPSSAKMDSFVTTY